MSVSGHEIHADQQGGRFATGGEPSLSCGAARGSPEFPMLTDSGHTLL